MQEVQETREKGGEPLHGQVGAIPGRPSAAIGRGTSLEREGTTDLALLY